MKITIQARTDPGPKRSLGCISFQLLSFCVFCSGFLLREAVSRRCRFSGVHMHSNPRGKVATEVSMSEAHWLTWAVYLC